MCRRALYLCIFADLCWRSLAKESTTPAPIPVPVGVKWYGYDGNWSPVDIRVGTPQQWLSVYPNTAGQETWVIGPGGCDGTSTCQEERGGIFYQEESSTWTEIGYYELGFDTQLGDAGDADYGLDNVDLSDEVLVNGQIVGVINTTEFWLGSLGLGVQPSRFEGTTNRLTFLSSLVENKSVIPSHSYGYTAGAYYRLKNVPASLTLGGIDTNRFVANDASFSLGPNQQPVVSVNSIKVSSIAGSSSSANLNWTSDTLTLQSGSQAYLYTVDSSTPFLWLPDDVCDSFAKAFNLVYNDTLQLYFYADNGTTLNEIQNQNITFTFTIADFPGSSNSVDISLPFAAFDLQLSFPYPDLDANVQSGSTDYFPLRRAPNSTQYTIGRSFLQEAYLIVDYERNNFSVSQATFALDSLTNVNLVPIARPANSNYTGPIDSSSGLSTGAEVGIGVGAAVLVASIVVLLVYIFVFKKRKTSGSKSYKSRNSGSLAFDRVPELSGDMENSTSELVGSSIPVAAEVSGDRRHPLEMMADSSTTRYEMEGSQAFEMAAGEVSTNYYEMTSRKPDSRHLAELENTDREMKNPYGPSAHRVPSPAPPYVQPDLAERLSDSISPNSENHSAQEFGTTTISSGEQGISPVGHGPHSRGLADGTSNQILSPISPQITTNYSKPTSTSHYKLRGMASRSDSSNSLLPPISPDGQPSRSPSRGSRFIENLEGPGPDSSPHTSPRPLSEERRFSWE